MFCVCACCSVFFLFLFCFVYLLIVGEGGNILFMWSMARILPPMLSHEVNFTLFLAPMFLAYENIFYEKIKERNIQVNYQHVLHFESGLHHNSVFLSWTGRRTFRKRHSVFLFLPNYKINVVNKTHFKESERTFTRPPSSACHRS